MRTKTTKTKPQSVYRGQPSRRTPPGAAPSNAVQQAAERQAHIDALETRKGRLSATEGSTLVRLRQWQAREPQTVRDAASALVATGRVRAPLGRNRVMTEDEVAAWMHDAD